MQIIDSNSQSRASRQIDVAFLDRDISFPVLQITDTNILRFLSMSIACNSQSGVSSSDGRR